jgi:hypothetical protein
VGYRGVINAKNKGENMLQKENDQPVKECFLVQKKVHTISHFATFCAILCVSVVMLGGILSALLSYHHAYAA